MNKEEVLFHKRMQDLAKTSYSRNIPIFTDFLNMNEISILHSMSAELAGVRYELYGGYDLAERQMAMFAPDALFDEPESTFPDLSSFSFSTYPIVTLKIEPAHKKFAEKLTHRDYLGSLLGLGIERCKIGDIILSGDHSDGTKKLFQGAYVFCCSKMADFFIHELYKVRHTQVRVSISYDDVSPAIQLQEVKGSVASLRADALIALVCRLSRSAVITLFQSQRVFINGRLTESNSYILKAGDIVSVRGYGKFIFEEVLSMTKKERYYVLIKTYGNI